MTCGRTAVPLATATLLLLVASAEGSITANMSMMVPAYFYPAGSVCGGTLGYWDCLVSTAASSPALYDGGIVIVNPGSGPGTTFDSTYGKAINRTRQAADEVRAKTLSMATAVSSRNPPWTATIGRRRLEVVGYIETGYGARVSASVVADAVQYTRWYNVSGFFLDECSDASAHVDNYTAIATQLRALLPGAKIVCNFGMVPQTQQYMQACDVLVIHEDYASRFGQNGIASWVNTTDRARFAR
jgi:hypothetical protein